MVLQISGAVAVFMDAATMKLEAPHKNTRMYWNLSLERHMLDIHGNVCEGGSIDVYDPSVHRSIKSLMIVKSLHGGLS